MSDLQRPGPPYMQIADRYRELISTGVLRQGDRLPTLAEIAETYRVSPGTANKAMRQLRGEGLIDTRQQGSTVVGGIRAVPHSAERAQRPAFDTTDDEHVDEVGVVPMLPSVGAALGVDADALNRTVIRRQSVTSRDTVPYKLSVIWVDTPFSQDVPELLEPAPVNVIELIAERTGRKATAGHDYFEGRSADEREAQALRVEVGAPILAGTSVWMDNEGPIAYYEFVCPSSHVVSNRYQLLT